jgi:hypothetical protein
MPVLVSDTSVIIDLERGVLLEDLFRLPFGFAMPDLLFHRELTGPLLVTDWWRSGCGSRNLLPPNWLAPRQCDGRERSYPPPIRSPLPSRKDDNGRC